MSSEPPRPQLELRDPKAMRAMAHPVRMALIDMLAVVPALTATQASEALGESPANCAFHLRTLAKYGFVEEAGGGRGRERPWRLANSGITLTAGPKDEPSVRMAAESLTAVWMDRLLGRIRDAFARRAWPDDWYEEGVTSKQAVRWLTREEAGALTKELGTVMDRYRGRSHDPAQRPAGALPVEMNLFVFPDMDMARLAAGTDEDRDSTDEHRGSTDENRDSEGTGT